MLNLASAVHESGVISLRDYIAEQAPEKSYRFVVIHNEPEWTEHNFCKCPYKLLFREQFD